MADPLSENLVDDSGGAQAGKCPREACNHAVTYSTSVCLGCGAIIYGGAFSTENPPPAAVQERWSIPTDELLKLTEALDEHPEGWDWPCACAFCRSYADG